jgi:hypothetical protein
MALSVYSLIDLIREHNTSISFSMGSNYATIYNGRDILFNSTGPKSKESAEIFLSGMLSAYRMKK